MRIARLIVAVLLIAGLLFGTIGSPSALAAGPDGKPTAEELYKLQRDYLAGLAEADAIPASAGNATRLLKAAAGTADLDVPADVRQLESFKRGEVQIIIGPLGRTLIEASPAASGSSMPALGEMQAAHQAAVQTLAQVGISLSSRVDFYVTYNGIAGWVKTSDIAKVRSAVGKDKVHYARVLTADLGASVPLIGSGTSGVWTNPGVDGTGTYVGVIDTGIDWKHPDFGGNAAWTYPANFPTAKVVAAYDFGDNDGDPMDSNGHGTHVSGIMAADGAVKGVAPKAKIVFAKIVQSAAGSASSVDIMRAFDYMADPLNLDGGPEGVHPPVASVNMSFGSAAGFVDPADPEMVAIENCITSGVTVALSAGNSAEYYNSTPWYPWYPDYSMIGSPALTPGSIAVASSDNGGYTMYGMTDTSSTAWGYELPGASYFYPAATDPPKPQDVWAPTQDVPYQVIGTTNPATLAPGALAGKIAVMQRRSGADRLRYARAAQDKGAIGVIYYDTTDKYLGVGYLYGFQNDGTYCDRVTIPVVFTRNVSTAWAALAVKTVRFNALVSAPWSVVANGGPTDAVSSFSSWGAPPDLSFKPDVTAPGGGIWSTVPVAQGTYEVMSGTSMASPHVAAAAALIKEAHPTWVPADIKTALSNTATLTTDSRTGVTYSPRRIGAGRINVYDALHTPTYVTESTTGKPSVALGSVTNWQSAPITFSLTLTNSSQASVAYAVSGTAQWTRSDLAPTLMPGAVVSSSSPTVVVPANGSASVVITVDATGVTLDTSHHPFVEGFISFTPLNPAASIPAPMQLPVLHVPYMGFLGEYNDFDTSNYGTTFNPLVDLPGELNFSGWWAYYVLDAPGYTQTGVTWPSDPTYGDYNMGMGWDGTYSLNNVAINPNKPYADVWGSIKPWVWMLRNAQSLSVDITNAAGTLIKHLDTAEWLYKSDLGNSDYPLPIYDSNPNDGTPWVWYGENAQGSTVADGQYHMILSATPQKLVNRLTSDSPQVIDFPVSVDTVNPVCVINTITPVSSGREIKWTTSDATPSSGIWGQLVWWKLASGSTGSEMVGPSVRSFVAPADVVEAEVYAWDNANNLSSFTAPATRTIVSTSKGLGSVSPAGTTTVNYGGSRSFVFTPAPGYAVVDVLVDGVRTATSGGYTFTNVTKNHTIAVTFGDVLPPALSLTTKGDLLSTSSDVSIPFDVSDSSGVVMMSVKEGGSLILAGAPAVSPLVLKLTDGQHRLEVIAEDASGNKAGATINVLVDTKSPVIALTEPASDHVNSPTLHIAGTVVDEVSGLRSLTIGGDSVIPYGDGSFIYDASLVKGTNEITLEARDNAGHIVQAVISVTYEPQKSTAPSSLLVVLTIGKREIVVNGMPVSIDAAPIIRNGRTLLPIRALIETLGGEVVWNSSSRTVNVSLGGRSVSVVVGRNIGHVNGKPVSIDSANAQVVPEIINGRTFLPLRFIAEGLGLDLAWDAGSQTVSLTYWP